MHEFEILSIWFLSKRTEGKVKTKHCVLSINVGIIVTFTFDITTIPLISYLTKEKQTLFVLIFMGVGFIFTINKIVIVIINMIGILKKKII